MLGRIYLIGGYMKFLLKSLMIFGLLGCNMFVAAENKEIVIINEAKILKSFPEYTKLEEEMLALKKKLEDTVQAGQKKFEPRVKEIEKMQSELKNTKDLSKSAGSLAKLESKKKALQKDMMSAQKEVDEIRTEIVKVAKKIDSWSKKHYPYYLRAIQSMVEKKGNVKIVISLPEGKVVYYDHDNDTVLVRQKMHEIANQGVKNIAPKSKKMD